MKQQLWNTLLQITDQVSGFEGDIDFCCFKIDDPDSVVINAVPDNNSYEELTFVSLSGRPSSKKFDTKFKLSGISKLELLSASKLSRETLSFLNLYLPYCFLSQLAKKKKRAISIAHFAQTLDGKIATKGGHSHWIGNEENLDHAHRMRALSDAIVIGRNTLEKDMPRLTVRRVEGKNPKRVVIGSSGGNFNSLTECCSDPIIVIGKEESNVNGQIQYYHLKSDQGKIKGNDILECLYKLGIKTVYIEGGSITTSNFLKDRSVDILQLHFSPFLFGSGKQGIELPAIKEVDDGIQFQNFSYFPIGDTVMFVGQPQ